MALAIASTTVFPAMYFLGDLGVGKLNKDIDNAVTEQQQLHLNNVLAGLQNLQDPVALANVVSELFQAKDWALYGGLIGTFGKIVADLFVQVLVIPAIALGVTSIVTYKLARVLGGDVHLALPHW